MITAFKRIMILATVVVCGAVSANATSYLFDDGGEGNDWNTEANWNPDGTPGGDDKAIIPAGLTCEIADANQSINILTINSGGVLRIKGKDLTITPNLTLLYRLDICGTLEFDIVNNVKARLIVGTPDLGIRGDGTMSASGSGQGVEIPFTGATLYIGDTEHEPDPDDRVTIKGAVQFHLHIVNDGHLLVDDLADTMEIGYMIQGGPMWVEVRGAKGDFKVTSGTMKFGHTWCMLGEKATWDVAGGTLEQTSYADLGWINAHHLVKVSSGTLLLNEFFATDGGLLFSGGTIEVGAHKAVSFSKAE